MSDIVERARIKSGMLKMGERIAFGSDAELIDEMADEITRLRSILKDREWRDISEATDADKMGCIVAAWNTRSNAFEVGEAQYFDGFWWWANQGPGDYYARTITPDKFQPLPPPPEKENT